MKKIKKIIIVGGGAAGWMTAALLLKKYPQINFTLIESDNILPIGVGESTIESINVYFHDLGLKDDDFMVECDAIYKTSIDFTNWDGKSTRFNYPFGSTPCMEAAFGARHPKRWFVKQALLGGDKNEYARFAVNHVSMLRKNKLTKNEYNTIEDWDFNCNTAYHLDHALFTNYLKTKYCEPKGINHITGHIVSVVQNDDGSIKHVKSDQDVIYEADLYIDCSGSKSILLGQTLNEPYRSFKPKLQNDRAVAIQLPYLDKNLEMEHSTNATTLSSGWCWNIPLFSRIGTGYVYCSDFLTKDEAETEFRNYLINHRDIKHDKKEIESISVNHIEFNAGTYENTWVKNVCAIGMSAGFIEPLESTGLALFYGMAWALCNAIKDQQYSGLDVSYYNKTVQNDMSRYAGFVAGHYAYAERSDTDYWKMVTNEIDYLDSDHPDWNWFQRVHTELCLANDFDKFDSSDGTFFIIAGMGGNPCDKRLLEDGRNPFYQTMLSSSQQIEQILKTKIIKEDKLAENLLNNYEFLTQTIYKNA